MSHFGFITNNVLRNNLDIAFSHVLTLINLLNSNKYQSFEINSFHKTIIIYTASIIEALLYYHMIQKCKTTDFIKHEWKLSNIKELYSVDSTHKVVGGDYLLKPVELKPEKMNLGLINDLLFDTKVIDKLLFSKIDKVRLLRNDQHFATHQVIKEYSQKDLEFVFSVAKEVKEFVQN